MKISSMKIETNNDEISKSKTFQNKIKLNKNFKDIFFDM